jgi:hypothetical protein
MPIGAGPARKAPANNDSKTGFSWKKEESTNEFNKATDNLIKKPGNHSRGTDGKTDSDEEDEVGRTPSN